MGSEEGRARAALAQWGKKTHKDCLAVFKSHPEKMSANNIHVYNVYGLIIIIFNICF